MDGATVERLLGVEMSYIDWVLEQDGEYVNGEWVVQAACCSVAAREFGFCGLNGN